MFSLTGIKCNIEFSLLLSVIVALVLGLLLVFIKVPGTEYSRKLARTKTVLSINMFVTSFLFYVAYCNSGLEHFEKFASLVIFVITDMATLFLSSSLISLMDEKYLDRDKHYITVFVKAVLDFFLLRSFFWESSAWRLGILIVCVVLFAVECISHIIMFDKVYKLSVSKLENYSDEDEQRKIHWIRFCYIIMMLTQMFVLVYLLLPSKLILIYAMLYSLYMVYFTANFVSFLGSHKLLLDAFAYKALTFQERPRGKKKKLEPEDPIFNDVAFAKIEKYLDRWVADKKYRESDRTREQVAKELHTNKEMMQMYFNVCKKKDFRTWRTELRVGDARKMLLENRDLSIQAVGESCGFSDRSNFHRQFTQIVGCSPKAWRESNGKFKPSRRKKDA